MTIARGISFTLLATVLATVLATAVLGGEAGASDPSVCLSLKYKAIGKAALAKAKCGANAAKAGAAVDPACIATAEVKLARRLATAEKKGDCVKLDDYAAALGVVDDFAEGATVALEAPAPTPTPSPLCCETGNSCWHGFVAGECEALFGTLGAPGTVCHGATGQCAPPPASSGSCCYLPSLQICEGGPSLDLAGCVAGGGLDFPFVATCEPNGACSFPGP